jgi:polyphosphate glucokinase
LSIDIGGTHIKGSVLDPAGSMIAERVEIDTPLPADPANVLDAIISLARRLPSYDRVSAGFPGVVKLGLVITAPNLGTGAWRDFDLARALCERLHAPARVINDAVVQGLGVVEGHGLECALTLGTGVGCALYRDRRLVLPMEFGQHRVRGRKTYDQYLGNAALRAKGKKRWNRRLRKTIDVLASLVNYDVLYIGGGNARKVDLDLPDNVRVVSNTAGITGGVRLWDADMAEHFAHTG